MQGIYYFLIYWKKCPTTYFSHLVQVAWINKSQHKTTVRLTVQQSRTFFFFFMSIQTCGSNFTISSYLVKIPAEITCRVSLLDFSIHFFFFADIQSYNESLISYHIGQILLPCYPFFLVWVIKSTKRELFFYWTAAYT